MRGRLSRSYEEIVDHLTLDVSATARWVFADEATFEALRWNEPVVHGPRSRALRSVLGAADRIGLSLIAAAITGFIELLRTWRRQRLHGPSTRATDASGIRPRVNVFVGFGARSEEQLFSHFRQHVEGDVLRVDQTRLEYSTGGVAPNVRDIFRSFADAVGNMRVAMRSLPVEYSALRLDILTSAARRLAGYVYGRAWWKAAKRRFELGSVVFLTPDTMAFGAIAEGVRSVYQQHGLLARGIVFPAFAEVWPLTRPESEYLRGRIAGADIKPLPPVQSQLRVRQKRVLIASGHRSVDEMMLVAPLVRHLARRGVTAHVRLYNGEAVERFWQRADLGAPFEIEPSGETLDEALARVQPMFVASWGSTVLVDALYRGIIPITVAADDDRLVARTAYPLFRCCLRWPIDHAAVDDVLTGAVTAERIVDRLLAQELAS